MVPWLNIEEEFDKPLNMVEIKASKNEIVGVNVLSGSQMAGGYTCVKKTETAYIDQAKTSESLLQTDGENRVGEIDHEANFDLSKFCKIKYC